MQSLQDILFPVKYSNNFYESLFQDRYITCLAFDTFEKKPPCNDVDYKQLGHTDEDFHSKHGRLVGVVTANIERTQDIGCRRQVEGYISTLGVDPAWRRIGLGYFLLQSIIKLLKEKGCTIITLHVLDTNAAALAMYKKAKFKVSEKLIDHYHFYGAYHNAFKLDYEITPSTCIFL